MTFPITGYVLRRWFVICEFRSVFPFFFIFTFFSLMRSMGVSLRSLRLKTRFSPSYLFSFLCTHKKDEEGCWETGWGFDVPSELSVSSTDPWDIVSKATKGQNCQLLCSFYNKFQVFISLSVPVKLVRVKNYVLKL